MRLSSEFTLDWYSVFRLTSLLKTTWGTTERLSVSPSYGLTGPETRTSPVLRRVRVYERPGRDPGERVEREVTVLSWRDSPVLVCRHWTREVPIQNQSSTLGDFTGWNRLEPCYPDLLGPYCRFPPRRIRSTTGVHRKGLSFRRIGKWTSPPSLECGPFVRQVWHLVYGRSTVDSSTPVRIFCSESGLVGCNSAILTRV